MNTQAHHKTLPVVAVSAALAALSLQSHAQTLTEAEWRIIGSQNAPTSNTAHNISVADGFYQGYSGQANNDTGGTTFIEESFGGAPILDYAFYKKTTDTVTYPGNIEAYAAKPGGPHLTSMPTTPASGGNVSDPNVWDTNDPGDYTFPNAANFTGGTGVKIATCTGTIDISTLSSGRIYFFHGGYQGESYYDITMSDTDLVQPDVELLEFSRNDHANNNEFYVAVLEFDGAADYETITYTYKISNNNSGRGRHNGVVVVGAATDVTAPSAPAWETLPTALDESSVTMTAAESTDPEGAPVSYRFTNVTWGHDSGWQSGRTWTDTLLDPSTQYDYIIEVRDNTPNQNTTAASTQESATTQTPDVTAPPTPGFAVAPTPNYPNNPYEITMTAETVVDPEGADVEYYFTCTQGTSNGGVDSGWQTSPIYVNTGLDPETTYEYTVTARDTSISLNESAPSAPASTTTSALPTGTITDPGAGSFFLIGSNTYEVSVFPGNNGFRSSANAISETFGVNPGDTVQGYGFFKESGTTPDDVEIYASDAGSKVTYVDHQIRTGGNFQSGNQLDNLWTVTDPGSPDWLNPADYTTATNASAFEYLDFSIDISGMTTGSVYFFYAAWRSTPYFDFVMVDTDGIEAPAPFLNIGGEDGAQGEEWYCKRIDFDNSTGYDKIEVHFTGTLYNGYPNARFAGAVLVGPGGASGNDFATWIGGYNVGGQTGFNDDPDGDGSGNGVEAFFGSDPSVGASLLVPGTKTGNVFTFHHPQADPVPTDISGSYEWTTDLTNWHPAGTVGDTTVAITATPNDPQAGTTKVEADTTGSAVDPTLLFLRAVATQN